MIKRRILVPVDFSIQSDAALRYAGNLAQSTNDLISCLYVIDEKAHGSDVISSRELRHRKRRDAEQKLSERVNSMLGDGENIKFEIIVTSGRTDQKILEKALDLQVRLIIVGKSVTGKNRTSSISSDLKRLITRSTIPVITVSNPQTTGRSNIILPLELSKPMATPLKTAIEIALRTKAKIRVVCVYEHDMPDLLSGYKDRLEEIRTLLDDLEIECDTKLIKKTAEVSEVILSYANSIEGAFILLMTRNENHSRDRLLGTTAGEIITHSNIPVQSINPDTIHDTYKVDSEKIIKTNPYAGFIFQEKTLSRQNRL